MLFKKSGVRRNQQGDIYQKNLSAGCVWLAAGLPGKLKNAIISHNHPADVTEYSFSKEDLELFLEKDLAVLRDVDEKYTYGFSRKPRETERLQGIFDLPADGEDGPHEYMTSKAQEAGISYRRMLNDQGAD